MAKKQNVSGSASSSVESEARVPVVLPGNEEKRRPRTLDIDISAVLNSLDPNDLDVLSVKHTSMVVSARRIIRDKHTDKKEEKVEFVSFKDNDLISLRHGGSVDGLVLPAGVYLAHTNADGEHVLRQLPYMQRDRAIALFREVGTIQRAFVHTLPANDEVKKAIGMKDFRA